MKKNIIKLMSFFAALILCISRVNAATIVVGNDTTPAGAANRSVSVELKDADLKDYVKVQFDLVISGTTYADKGDFTPKVSASSAIQYSYTENMYTFEAADGLFETTLGSLAYITTENLNSNFTIKPVNVRFYKADETADDGKIQEGTIKFELPKSDDATLSSLSISQGEISPTFDSSVLEYTATVPDTIQSINISATTSHAKATKTGTGRQTLAMGENEFEIAVTAEDGATTKTYKITIIRGEVKNEVVSAYLESLTISNIGCELSPEFDKQNNKYTVEVPKGITSLNFKYTTEDENATVKIEGNDKLEDGENEITITVTSSNEKDKQVYEILATRTEEEVPIAKPIEPDTEVKESKKSNLWLLITLIAIVVILTILIAVILFKKKNKNKAKKLKVDDVLKEEKNLFEDEKTTTYDKNAFKAFAEEDIEKTKEFNFKDFQ